MPAEEIWNAQMQADRGGGDTMSGYRAPDCTRTLMPPGTTLRGPADPQAEQPEHGHEREVVRVRRLPGGDQQGLELQVSETEGR
jgi:hypothetical protein